MTIKYIRVELHPEYLEDRTLMRFQMKDDERRYGRDVIFFPLEDQYVSQFERMMQHITREVLSMIQNRRENES